ncbi:MAG: Mo-dependent nitrogenase C-terminal domain-containing protein [Cyanobacteriota bacterium]|nr:Mo-dependent nitrogenase C-terminal domain-containing protein [Cyanobacteriota bacterium]
MTNMTGTAAKPIIFSSWNWATSPKTEAQPTNSVQKTPQKKKFDLLHPLRQWLNNIEVADAQLAHHLCYLIPAQCPFERDIKLFGRALFHIPPLCKLNPLYEELVMLRFRALCYLADECGEDIGAYC